MGLAELAWQLDREIASAQRHLSASAECVAPGRPWLTVFKDLRPPAPAVDDVAALYRTVIHQLRRHSLEAGFLPDEAIAACDVAIKTIPDYLRPVRADAAYSIPPVHPPRGCVFFIRSGGHQTVPPDIRLLAAHETYPGHHLLDTRRWSHPRLLRRSLEFPLFYEGWASFGEEILFDTGFFSGPADRLLSAKRRYWRACRGRVDLRLHTGQWGPEQAALALCESGLVNRDTAQAMVRRYALKPGYQLAYTVGRRRFKALYTAYLGSGRTPARFVRDAVAHGEIGFDHLAAQLLG
jgi:uncharacterized protein (DUF885 family)